MPDMVCNFNLVHKKNSFRKIPNSPMIREMKPTANVEITSISGPSSFEVDDKNVLSPPIN